MIKKYIRLLSMLLALCLSMGVLAVPVSAAEVDSGPDGFCCGGKVFTYSPGDPKVMESLEPRVDLRRVTVLAEYQWIDGIGLIDLIDQIYAVAGPVEIQKVQAFVEPEAADAIALAGTELALDVQKLPRESDVTLVIWDENENQSVLMIKVAAKNMTVFYGVIALLVLLAVLILLAVFKKVDRAIRFHRYKKEREQWESEEIHEEEPEKVVVSGEMLVPPALEDV